MYYIFKLIPISTYILQANNGKYFLPINPPLIERYTLDILLYIRKTKPYFTDYSGIYKIIIFRISKILHLIIKISNIITLTTKIDFPFSIKNKKIHLFLLKYFIIHTIIKPLKSPYFFLAKIEIDYRRNYYFRH